jgi:hypothetical protein
MMDRPFHATSLQDFWSNRWHGIFYRSFDRMTLPIISLIPKSSPRGVHRVARAIAVFSFSALFHIFLIQRMLVAKPAAHAEDFEPASIKESLSPPLLDPCTLKFFLSQPLGLLLERVLVVPVTSALPDGFLRVTLRRLWAWGWLLWSGRFWADAWVRGGMWNEDEGYVGWSPVRGLLYGDPWVV